MAQTKMCKLSEKVGNCCLYTCTSCATRRCRSFKKAFGQKIDLYLTYNNICHYNFQSAYHERSVLCS